MKRETNTTKMATEIKEKVTGGHRGASYEKRGRYMREMSVGEGTYGQ